MARALAASGIDVVSGGDTPNTPADRARTDILINVSAGETRAAHLENGVLKEIHIQRDSARSTVGNIYVGEVQRVLTGMQAAFVDIGLERSAFLQVSDIAHCRAEAEHAPPCIQSLLNQGDRVLVQVTKDAMGKKGARLTTDLTIPSRLLVYMPYTPRVGISARIEDEAERERLSAIIAGIRDELGLPGGFIVRTAGDGAPYQALANDIAFLDAVWRDVETQAKTAPRETRLYGDLPLPIRMLRDLMVPDVTAIIIDDTHAWHDMRAFTQQFAPELTERTLYYAKSTPLFNQYGVEEAIERALQPTVPLKSGGFLVIEQTEAMVTIDVNTGGYVGTHSLGQTVLRTNIEAAHTLARQLRLRNLGGIIVIDFIDMADDNHKHKVITALDTALEADPAKTTVSAISPLGLVEITRKRTRNSLQHLLCTDCQSCSGRGFVKTGETVCYTLFREIARLAHSQTANELLILAAPDLIGLLLDEFAAVFNQICEDIGIKAHLQAESLYPAEQFDLVVM